jgi:hypothetical protein
VRRPEECSSAHRPQRWGCGVSWEGRSMVPAYQLHREPAAARARAAVAVSSGAAASRQSCARMEWRGGGGGRRSTMAESTQEKAAGQRQRAL